MTYPRTGSALLLRTSCCCTQFHQAFLEAKVKSANQSVVRPTSARRTPFPVLRRRADDSSTSTLPYHLSCCIFVAQKCSFYVGGECVIPMFDGCWRLRECSPLGQLVEKPARLYRLSSRLPVLKIPAFATICKRMNSIACSKGTRHNFTHNIKSTELIHNGVNHPFHLLFHANVRTNDRRSTTFGIQFAREGL